MNPTELRQHLAEYADGELAPALRTEIETLLAGDPAARAEVERWQALRRCAQRALASETLPAGLADRVRTAIHAQSAVRLPRLYRLGLPGLAVAAAVVLAFFIWPKGAEATSVPASSFAAIYRKCAVEHRHDSLVRGPNGSPTLAGLRAAAPLVAGLPDLTAGGYRLDGACRCGPRECKDNGAKVVHVYFRRSDNENDVVSAFAVQCRLKLCARDGSPCRGCKCAGVRPYRGDQDGDVSLVSWTDHGVSYILVGRMPQEMLTKLAEGPALAVRPIPRPATAGNRIAAPTLATPYPHRALPILAHATTAP
jgi:anti-sigma factor RsiW